MAFEVTGLEREFRIKIGDQDTPLADPNQAWTPDQVMTFYANQYPALTTATVHGPEQQGDKIVYEFKTVLGTKG